VAFPARIAIASRNAHKLREIGRICADWPVEWLTVENHEGPWPDVEETGSTYLENALMKARAGAAALGEPALADDSGIEVDALGGRPGPRSARFAGEDATDEQNLAALIRALKGVPRAGRTARYRCVAVLAFPEGGKLHADGICEGILVPKPRGARGFGYDPIFVVPGVGREVTMAELSDQEKDRISHRGRAFRALRETLEAGESP
jgi:XTP/dITP diphosphohydrolase